MKYYKQEEGKTHLFYHEKSKLRHMEPKWVGTNLTGNTKQGMLNDNEVRHTKM